MDDGTDGNSIKNGGKNGTWLGVQTDKIAGRRAFVIQVLLYRPHVRRAWGAAGESE